jgi:hypothetical protein
MRCLFIGGTYHGTVHEVDMKWGITYTGQYGYLPPTIWRLQTENPAFAKKGNIEIIQYERQELRNNTGYRSHPFYFYLAQNHDLTEAMKFLVQKGII